MCFGTAGDKPPPYDFAVALIYQIMIDFDLIVAAGASHPPYGFKVTHPSCFKVILNRRTV